MYFNTVVTNIIQTVFFRLDFRQLIYDRTRSNPRSAAKRQRGARVDTRPDGPTLAGVPRGAPVKELRDPPNRYRGNPLNLIRVMPAKGQDMATVASPRFSQAYLNRIALRLNQRPRKTLGFETSADRLRAVLQ